MSAGAFGHLPSASVHKDSRVQGSGIHQAENSRTCFNVDDRTITASVKNVSDPTRRTTWSNHSHLDVEIVDRHISPINSCAFTSRFKTISTSSASPRVDSESTDAASCSTIGDSRWYLKSIALIEAGEDGNGGDCRAGQRENALDRGENLQIQRAPLQSVIETFLLNSRVGKIPGDTADGLHHQKALPS